MKYRLLVFFILCSTCLHAQKRPPDYRNDKESFKKIKNKTIRKELAGFTLAGGEEKEEGITLNEIPLKQSGSTFAQFGNDSLSVSIQTGIFLPEKHKLSYFDSTLIKIDDKPFWGTAGEMPVKTIFAVQVSVGQQLIEVPFTALFDLYNPNLCWTDAKNKGTECRTGVYVSTDSKRVYITMLNGDNAGRYEVTWIFENGKYLKRVIDYKF
jgi:hypothetical protein